MSDGEDIMVVDLAMPDMKWGKVGAAQTAQVPLSFSYTDYAEGSPVRTSPTYTMANTGPPFLNPRFRCRLVQLNVGPSTAGSFWRLGGLRISAQKDGKL